MIEWIIALLMFVSLGEAAWLWCMNDYYKWNIGNLTKRRDEFEETLWALIAYRDKLLGRAKDQQLDDAATIVELSRINDQLTDDMKAEMAKVRELQSERIAIDNALSVIQSRKEADDRTIADISALANEYQYRNTRLKGS